MLLEVKQSAKDTLLVLSCIKADFLADVSELSKLSKLFSNFTDPYTDMK